MNKRYLISLIIFLVSFQLVNADIVSLNDAGDSSLVLTPNEPIEGFFFGESTTQNASEQGGLSPYEFDSRTVCKLAKQIDYKTLTGLNSLKQILYNETGHLIDQEKLNNILPQCNKITKTFPFYLILILVVMALSFLTYYNRKRLLLLMHEHKKKSSKSKSPDILRDLPKTKQ